MNTRPDRDTWLMKAAQLAAERSTCERAPVGAVIAREGRIVVTGYNGAPAGLPHCRGLDLTCGQPFCVVATHAEANAIAWAARHGVATDGCDLYCSLSPCVDCARLIINAGIREVMYATEYRLTDGINLLVRAGIGVGPWPAQ